jgi:hypothetical protein
VKKISCLQATYGRKKHVERALACFLAQDYPAREMLILNNNPVPLVFEHPLVRIVNEPGHPTLGHCRNRLLDFATGDFVRTWDDDDLYMGWSIRQGMEAMEEDETGAAAFKPTQSWYAEGHPLPFKVELQDNVFEAAITCRVEIAKKFGYKESGGDEHSTLLQGIEQSGGTLRRDFGLLTGYVYRWGNGLNHISGSLGSSRTLAERTQEWCASHSDTGDGKTPLQPAKLGQIWRAFGLCAAVKYGEGLAGELRGRLEGC